jgi:hypothetical protein
LQPRLQEAITVAVDDPCRALLDPQAWSAMTATSSATRRVSVQIDIAHREAVALDRGEQVDVADQTRHAVEFGDAEGTRRGDVGGSAASMSSRCPRTIVIGVFSSCRTSSRSRR